MAQMFTRNPGMGGFGFQGNFRSPRYGEAPPPHVDLREVAVRRLLELQVHRDIALKRPPLTWCRVQHPDNPSSTFSVGVPDARGGCWVDPKIMYASHGFKLVQEPPFTDPEAALMAYLARARETGEAPAGYVQVKRPENVDSFSCDGYGPIQPLDDGLYFLPSAAANAMAPHGFVVASDPVKDAIGAITAETTMIPNDDQIAARCGWTVEAVAEHRRLFAL